MLMLKSSPPECRAESDYFGKTEVVELIPGGKDVKVRSGAYLMPILEPIWALGLFTV